MIKIKIFPIESENVIKNITELVDEFRESNV